LREQNDRTATVEDRPIGARGTDRYAWAFLPPLLPLDVKIEDTGNGIRVTIIGRGRDAADTPLSGTVRYDIHYVADCDPETTGGISAALGRSTVIDAIDEPGKANMPGEKLISDAKYQNGWFLVTGVNAQGERSEPSVPRQMGIGIMDKRVPPNVDHFEVSENGEVHDGVAFSVLDIAYRAPNPLAGFNELQPLLQDYPKRGDLTAMPSKEYSGLPGGSASFKMVLQAARRPGTGTVTATNGVAVVTFGGAENALVQAQAGDELEILGVRGTILTVDSALQVTLTANWTGENVVALSSYLFLGKIRVYGRSVSAGGGYETDLTKVPYVDVVLDAELSTPNAPTLAVEAAGGLIRASVTIGAATGIDHVILYRGTGSGVAFASCSPLYTWPPEEVKPTATLQWSDTKFTTYEMENGQTFTYYAVVVNVRGQRSSPSAAAQASCRLNSGKEGDAPVGRLGLKNLLYNGFIGGTAGNSVLANDASQDYWFDVTVGVREPGVPFNASVAQSYGFGAFRGHTRWESGDGATGAAGARPKFQNGTEVHFDAPGSGKGWFLWQEVEAWESAAVAMPALARYRKIKRAGVYVLSAYIAALGGTAPDGYMRFFIEQHNNGTQLGNANRRYRLADDSLAWTTADYEISAALLTTEWQRFYAVFQMRTDLTPVKQLHVNIAWFNGTVGNVKVTQAMLNEGEEVGVFTADMGDPNIGWPVNPGDPPSGRGDGEGKRDGRWLEP
jgi:hypothetical protein